MKYLILLLAFATFSAQGYTPTEDQRKEFYEAFQSRDYPYLAEKLKDGYDPNDSNYDFPTKNHTYVATLSAQRRDSDFFESDLKLLRQFLEAGASVEATSDSGGFPLYFAEEIEVASILDEFGADFTRIYHNTRFGVIEGPERYIRNPRVLEVSFNYGVVPTCREANVRWYRGGSREKRENRELYDRFFLLHFGKNKVDFCDADDDWGF
ncbi:hypothetical protein [Halobacteriovorax sp. HLS]|uniref:hypothetical protein n=1 Tax=Halobacteriovorax sp. HLS TaxID=2234000 RepID=UPI000FDC0F58|nr:hypothetical protein [Halobacteriovorax sp. HLS]